MDYNENLKHEDFYTGYKDAVRDYLYDNPIVNTFNQYTSDKYKEGYFAGYSDAAKEKINSDYMNRR